MNRFFTALLAALLFVAVYAAAVEPVASLPDGVRILASLKTQLNVTRTEPGDLVELEVAANLRGPGGVLVIPKGAKLVGTGVKARVSVSDEVGRLVPEVEMALYRVVQEALHNVAKHAQAKTVNVQMAREGGNVRLVIEDDGVGISSVQNPQRRSFGLTGMRERVGTLGGTMRVTSRKNQGTRIAISVPVSKIVNLQELPRGAAMPLAKVNPLPAPLADTGSSQ